MARQPESTGDTPPGYDPVAELGRGGYGVVVLARQRAVGRLVAVKRIRGVLLGGPGANGQNDGEVVERFRREGRILAALTHPAVVSVYDLVVSGADLSLVMEYVPGQSLRALMDRGPVPIGGALQVLADVAAALDYAAGRGVVHRDVKPANVFVLPSGRAKLGDFGIARMADDQSAFRSRAGAVNGTPAYIAPEQLSGETDLSRCDAYSFAVMTYELLTGDYPYQAEGAVAMLAAHLVATPRSPADLVPGFPPAAASPLLAGLAKDPAARLAPSALVAALAAVDAEAWPPRYRDPTPWPPPHAAVTDAPPTAADTLQVSPGVAVSPDPRSAIAPDVRSPVFRPPGARPGRRWRRWALIAVVATLACVAAVVAVRPWGGGRLAITGVTVVAAPPFARCPSATYAFTGSIQTNGRPGTIRLRWTQPDGTESPESTVRVGDGQRRVEAVLRFSVSGAAPFRGAARLHVLAPGPISSASVAIRYDCP